MNASEQVETVKNVVAEYYEKYGMHYGNFNEDEKEHIISIGTSIMCTKWDIGYPGGGFVQAFVDNDLMGAISRADGTSIKALKFFSILSYNVGMPQFA